MKTEEQKLREEIRAIAKMMKAMVSGKIRFTKCSLLTEDEIPEGEKYINPNMEFYHHDVEIHPKLMWNTLNQQKKQLQIKLNKLS